MVKQLIGSGCRRAGTNLLVSSLDPAVRHPDPISHFATIQWTGQTDRHTDRQTDRQTDGLGDITCTNTCLHSVDYSNMAKKGSKVHNLVKNVLTHYTHIYNAFTNVNSQLSIQKHPYFTTIQYKSA